MLLGCITLHPQQYVLHTAYSAPGTGLTACMHLAEAFVHSSCTLLLRRLLRKSVSGQGLACTATSTLYVAGRQYTVSVVKGGGGGSVQACSTSPTGGAGEDMTSAHRNASLTADKIIWFCNCCSLDAAS